MIELRHVLTVNDQGSALYSEDICGNYLWSNIKGLVEIKDFPCTKISINTDKKCNKCGLKGHSGKACIHSSQYLAYYFDDYLENKSNANPIKLDEIVDSNSIIVLKRVPWDLALSIYDKSKLYLYCSEREKLLQIKKLEPKIKRNFNDNPPNNYICHTCGIAGHWRQNCGKNKKRKLNKDFS